MQAKLCNLIFVGIFVFGIANGIPLKSNDEEEARQFIENASKSLYAFHDRMAEDTLESETEKLSNQTEFKDKELNYALKKLKKMGDLAVLGGERIFSTLAAKSNLESLSSNKDIEGYKNDSIKLAYFPDIQKIFATSNDPEEMKYYWNAWREKNDKWTMSNFLILVNSIKDAANFTGISGYEFWMRDFNMTQMHKVMEQIEPFYRQLHAFIRHQLNKKYGYSVINPKGLIPDHLFQQVLAQTWTNGSILDEIFPHKHLPQYTEILIKNNFDTLKLFKMADKFYESIGFDPIPQSYWGSRLKMKSTKDEGDCKATILALTSKVFMNYCHKMDFRTFLQAHGYMAQIHMAMEKPHLPAYYADSYNLEYAIGETVILSASSQKYLAKVGIVPSPEFSEVVFMNRLLRQSIHAMLNIPVYYVHTKVMAELFEGKFEMIELNKKYWEYMDKYVGVGPPGDREGNSFDFPFKFYLDLNENHQARKFMSEVLSYQFYMKLCSIADQYSKERLQNCDFSENKDAGDAIKKMIKLGSSKPMREVLATLLSEDPKLNGESLLTYYFPAYNWLTENNQENNVKVGWTHSDKKIDNVKLPEEGNK
ncbi:angiotensin-converting enzyme-like isoform X2 [Episyrphus balteatus]|uniref:angiotensin-converting enzyme-like isoform X2 n=1 Tax=Episyrphus balteatus TaxID=286459 RepID=UPI002486CB89|nr:angiotensin-converting enzyme-like isoform X2 [Episyrphus balteatus]